MYQPYQAIHTYCIHSHFSLCVPGHVESSCRCRRWFDASGCAHHMPRQWFVAGQNAQRRLPPTRRCRMIVLKHVWKILEDVNSWAQVYQDQVPPRWTWLDDLSNAPGYQRNLWVHRCSQWSAMLQTARASTEIAGAFSIDPILAASSALCDLYWFMLKVGSVPSLMVWTASYTWNLVIYHVHNRFPWTRTGVSSGNFVWYCQARESSSRWKDLQKTCWIVCQTCWHPQTCCDSLPLRMLWRDPCGSRAKLWTSLLATLPIDPQDYENTRNEAQGQDPGTYW